jgi:hypothetical protein
VLLQAPQLLISASVLVSQPPVFGAVVSQSAYPATHPVYMQVTPLQVAPTECVVSHATPHAPQFAIVSSGVSQPPRFAPELSQSA